MDTVCKLESEFQKNNKNLSKTKRNSSIRVSIFYHFAAFVLAFSLTFLLIR